MEINRPLSPHLSVYRWQPHMIVSILHRMTGLALSVGTLLLAWGLIAAASGAEAYADFHGFLSGWFGRLILFGFTWALMQHAMSGLRHLFMDTGEGFDLKTNRITALSTFLLSVILTLLVWVFGYGLI